MKLLTAPLPANIDAMQADEVHALCHHYKYRTHRARSCTLWSGSLMMSMIALLALGMHWLTIPAFLFECLFYVWIIILNREANRFALAVRLLDKKSWVVTKDDHHTGTYQSREDFENENLGKGKADPDIAGYPDEPETYESNPEYEEKPF